MGILLGPILHPQQKPPETDAERGQAVTDFQAKLAALAESPRAGELAAPAQRMAELLSQIAGDKTKTRDIETALLANLPGQLAALRDSLKAAPVALADLPADLRRRYVTDDGRARIEVFPKENLDRQSALERFVAAVRTVAPNATDTPVTLLEGGGAVIDAFKLAGTIAFCGISILLLAMLRDVTQAVFVLLPLILAGLLTAAFAVAFGIPFNFANIIAIPLLFSLGVAFGIYLVLRYREAGSVAALMHSSTPRAVVFSALTTMVSFGSLMVSSHRGTASMGQLLALCLTLALGCTLIVLPALLAWHESRSKM